MTAPPGLAPATEPRVEQISAERITDLSTRTKQMRFLVAELGVTRPQAHRLIKAYEADLRDAADVERIGNDSGRSDTDFMSWLMAQTPGGKKPSVRKWRVGEGGGWAVRS